MTYSIVARDPETGELGVGVQSRAFRTGGGVLWALPGVGAVATQSFTERGYGPLGLEASRAPGRRPSGRWQAWSPRTTTRPCARWGWWMPRAARPCTRATSAFPRPGTARRDGYTVQANMMRTADVWPAMAESFEAATGSRLARRLLAALDAAEEAAEILYAADAGEVDRAARAARSGPGRGSALGEPCPRTAARGFRPHADELLAERQSSVDDVDRARRDPSARRCAAPSAPRRRRASPSRGWRRSLPRRPGRRRARLVNAVPAVAPCCARVASAEWTPIRTWGAVPAAPPVLGERAPNRGRDTRARHRSPGRRTRSRRRVVDLVAAVLGEDYAACGRARRRHWSRPRLRSPRSAPSSRPTPLPRGRSPARRFPMSTAAATRSRSLARLALQAGSQPVDASRAACSSSSAAEPTRPRRRTPRPAAAGPRRPRTGLRSAPARTRLAQRILGGAGRLSGDEQGEAARVRGCSRQGGRRRSRRRSEHSSWRPPVNRVHVAFGGRYLAWAGRSRAWAEPSEVVSGEHAGRARRGCPGCLHERAGDPPKPGLRIGCAELGASREGHLGAVEVADPQADLNPARKRSRPARSGCDDLSSSGRGRSGVRLCPR